MLLLQPAAESDVDGPINAPSIYCTLGGMPDDDGESLENPGFEGCDSSIWTNALEK